MPRLMEKNQGDFCAFLSKKAERIFSAEPVDFFAANDYDESYGELFISAIMRERSVPFSWTATLTVTRPGTGAPPLRPPVCCAHNPSGRRFRPILPERTDDSMKRIFKTVDDHMTECTTLEKGCWVHLENPTKEEIDGLNTRFALDPTYLAAALDEEESARIEHDPDKGQTLIIVDIPYVESEGSGYVYSTIPLGIVLVDDIIITVCTRDTPIINDFTEERIRNFWTFKRTRFILQLLNRNASRFLAYLKQIDKASMHVQEKLEKSSRNQELIQMMKLEKSLVFFSTSLKSNEMVLEKLMRQTNILKQFPEDTDLLEDVIIENKQAIEMCAIYRDIMSGTMDAFASIISNNLNITMKVLTSLTAVLSVPTIIASLWGMNVGGIPFANSSFGFWAVLGIAVLAAVVSFVFMYKKQMFR